METESYIIQKTFKSALTVAAIVVLVAFVTVFAHYTQSIAERLGAATHEMKVPGTNISLPALDQLIIFVADLGIFVTYAMMVIIETLIVFTIKYRQLRSG